MILSLYAVLLAALPLSVYSARILGVFPLGAASHHRFTHPIMATLAQAGHEVVVYSPFPHILDDKPANFTHVHMANIMVVDKSEGLVELVEEISAYPFWKCLDLHWNYVDHLFPEFSSDKEVQKLLSSTEKFDLIVTEPFASQEFTLLLALKFKAPIIGVSAFPTNNIVNSNMGNSLSMGYIPDTCTTFSNKMTVIERICNAFASLRGLYYNYNYYIPKLERMMREHFPDMPPLKKLTNNLSLIFVNDHVTADYAQPRPPNIIPVAGIQIQPSRQLPQSIQMFMDLAKDGIIFFSLGTYVPDELQPKEYFDMYINTFKRIKQRVLWKTRNDNITGLPENVMTLKWAPQRDILAHPNCVLFITHGGQLSRVEALQFGVPVISIPQFFDQHKNSAFYAHERVGLRIHRYDLSENTLFTAISTVLGDPSYKENMKRLSAIFKDRPMSPAESVVFWTEYVLRHGGAAHLRPASSELRWYQQTMLDVILVIIVTILICISMLFFITRNILVCRSIT